VQVSLGSAIGTAGSVYQYIEFKNVSGTACTMYGFPGVSLRGGIPPSQIGAAATRAPNDNPSLVTLRRRRCSSSRSTRCNPERETRRAQASGGSQLRKPESMRN
jgi:hypothetical protein